MTSKQILEVRRFRRSVRQSAQSAQFEYKIQLAASAVVYKVGILCYIFVSFYHACRVAQLAVLDEVQSPRRLSHKLWSS